MTIWIDPALQLRRAMLGGPEEARRWVRTALSDPRPRSEAADGHSWALCNTWAERCRGRASRTVWGRQRWWV